MNRLVTTRSDVRIRSTLSILNTNTISYLVVIANLFIQSLPDMILLYLATPFYIKGLLHDNYTYECIMYIMCVYMYVFISCKNIFSTKKAQPSKVESYLEVNA